MKKCTPYPLSYNEYYTIKRVNTYLKPCISPNWSINCPIPPIPEEKECSDYDIQTTTCVNTCNTNCVNTCNTNCVNTCNTGCVNTCNTGCVNTCNTNCTNLIPCPIDCLQDYSQHCVIDIMSVNNQLI